MLAMTTFVGVVAAGSAAQAAEGDGFAGSSGEPAIGGSSAFSARAVNGRAVSGIQGVDVSHWQGSIDWQKVANAGFRFVFAKATDGRSYVDPTFATNLAGASRAGVLVGAYHFARPDDSTNDARIEADHFVDASGIGAGNLRPVLDIEVSGGLTPAEITRWALTWLARVRARLGVTPMVYTSPYGWQTRFGDTTAVADAGYPLWIAHWNVSSPTLPAKGWSGDGWTFWQYSNCGDVPGIHGCVDVDRYGSTYLPRMVIRRLEVGVEDADGGGPDGVVTSTPSGIDCGAACGRNFDAGTVVTLSATPSSGAYFTEWSGACEGAGTCSVTMSGDRTVTASFTTDLTPPVATIDPAASLVEPVSVRFDEIVRRVTPRNVVLRLDGQTDELAAGPRCRSGAGVKVDCATGNVRTVVLQPAAPLTPGQRYTAVVDPVGARPVRDRAGNAAARVSVDLRAVRGLEQRSAAVRYAWGRSHERAAFGRSYVAERLPGASASFSFHAPAVTWYTVTGRAQGRAAVLIDGRFLRRFDLGSSRSRYRVPYHFDHLGPGPHTITIRAEGDRSGSAAQIVVDAFGFAEGVDRTPDLAATWRRVDASKASGGSYAVSGRAGAAARLTFRGTGVDWTTVFGPNQGRAAIYLDGSLVRVMDGYAPTTTYGVVRSVNGLADGVHTLRIVATGDARSVATGALVAIDRFDVRP
jgi:GH25 family lysozyme M1 (1,4-beta-N-acetylmuramidase)